MAEDSEPDTPSEAAADGDPDSEDADVDPADSRGTTASDDAGAGSVPDADDPALDSDTDTVYSPADAPDAGGSIEDYLDDESSLTADETAPEGATGTDDPFDIDERRSVSDAVGAPAPDEALDEDPELELAPEVTADAEVETDAESTDRDADDGAPDGAAPTGRDLRDSTAPQGWTREDDTDEADTGATPPPDPVATADSADSAAESSDTTPATTGGSVVSGETTVEPQPPSAPDPSSDVDDGLVGEGPASDEEMPLAAHIEEMVRRLAVVLVVGGVVALGVFPIADNVINYLWNAHIPGAATNPDLRPRLYGPLELLLTELKVAALAGFVVGLPVAVYETYLFMRPGLFPRERRYYLAAVPTSLVLALIGVGFAHFVVLPAIFAYFTVYTEQSVELIAFGLKETFGLILVLMGYMALVFQIPLFIMLAIMMNLTTRQWLEGRRLLFWGGFLGISFLVSPDPTGMAPIIVAATMITLFEGTLALLRWTGN